MAKIKILMPDVGEGVTEAEITEWHVKPGDLVREDDVLAAVMTDKATVEIPSPVDGVITSTTGDIGDVIAVGETIVSLEVSNAQGAPDPAGTEPADIDRIGQSVSKATTPRSEKPTETTQDTAGRLLAAPAVRHRAAIAGVDLSEVTGSGPGGRITAMDLETWINNPTSSTKPEMHKLPSDEFEEIRILGLRRKIAEHMQVATRNIAHITYVEEVDVTDLEILREELNSKRIANNETRFTILPFLMIAMSRALTDNPGLNAHYAGDTGLIRRFRSIHLGMATQTANGLLVPVIRNAGAFDLSGLAAEIIRLSDAAKSGTIKREELVGSTITLSSLGKMGGLMSTPIVNAPEVAIVGVNKISMRQVWRDGGFIPRKIMNLSSSFDHRVVDGWDAAVFIQAMKALIENPASILVDR